MSLVVDADGVVLIGEPKGDTVLIQEPFDYDLFYPWVPLFIAWEVSESPSTMATKESCACVDRERTAYFS